MMCPRTTSILLSCRVSSVVAMKRAILIYVLEKSTLTKFLISELLFTNNIQAPNLSDVNVVYASEF